MKLSPKEVEVITLVAKGYVDKQIGSKLKISDRTVQTHITRIMLKLNAKNRANAIAIYMLQNPNWISKILK